MDLSTVISLSGKFLSTCCQFFVHTDLNSESAQSWKTITLPSNSKYTFRQALLPTKHHRARLTTVTPTHHSAANSTPKSSGPTVIFFVPMLLTSIAPPQHENGSTLLFPCLPLSSSPANSFSSSKSHNPSLGQNENATNRRRDQAIAQNSNLMCLACLKSRIT